jgi:hypothetical protein
VVNCKHWSLYLGINPGTHWIEGCVDLKAGLNISGRRKVPSFCRIVQPVAQSIYWLNPPFFIKLVLVETHWNVMAHAQKPDFVFRRNGRVHLNRRGASVQSTTGSRGVHISGSNAGYTTFRGSVQSTGYPLHSPVFPSLPLPCSTVCHDISAVVYLTLHYIIKICSLWTALSHMKKWRHCSRHS